jgi:hypothetical protein
MKIAEPSGITRKRCAGKAAFTIIEVAFSAAIAALVLAGMFQGYNLAGRQAQFSACNLAANAAATRQLEQVISANWVPSYGDNTMLNMNGMMACNNLCLPSANGNLINCTNFVFVTNVPGSAGAPYAFIEVQCVWSFPTYGGVFTNTVSVLRAPNL